MVYAERHVQIKVLLKWLSTNGWLARWWEEKESVKYDYNV